MSWHASKVLVIHHGWSPGILVLGYERCCLDMAVFLQEEGSVQSVKLCGILSQLGQAAICASG